MRRSERVSLEDQLLLTIPYARTQRELLEVVARGDSEALARALSILDRLDYDFTRSHFQSYFLALLHPVTVP